MKQEVKRNMQILNESHHPDSTIFREEDDTFQACKESPPQNSLPKLTCEEYDEVNHKK